MGADLRLAVAEDARASRAQPVARGMDVIDLVADMVDPARGILLEKAPDRGILAEGVEKLDLGVRQFDEDDGDAVIGLVLRRADRGAERVAILRRSRLEIRHGNGDMVQATDHGRLRLLERLINRRSRPWRQRRAPSQAAPADGARSRRQQSNDLPNIRAEARVAAKDETRQTGRSRNMDGRKPVVLCILDGWGLRESREANAVALARTPNFDRIWETCPHARLSAHGPDVGLPEGQMGNSEVGHMNIGAGRIVLMDLPRIDKAIEEGRFETADALRAFIGRLKETGGRAHVAGLASPGGVHAHDRHIVRAAEILAGEGIPVLVHAFLDGRDVPPRSARDQIADLEARLPQGAVIATVSGRFHAMDRDRRWDRIEAAFRVIARGEGARAESADAAIASAYERGESDEFVTPTVIGDYRGVEEGDGLLFVNFRADRAREILHALLDPGFDAFDRGPWPGFASACGMVSYSAELDRLMPAMFPPEEPTNTLGAWVAGHGLAQFRLAETEKYPHVTFFLNGGREEPEPGEERHMAPSPKVRTYDLKPEMAAGEVTERLCAAIRSGRFDLIVVNYANPDMVGHTGSLEAAIAACEAVDRGLGAALEAMAGTGGAMIVTADHGNAEMMVDPETGGPHTAHTLNPVPVILVGAPDGARLRDGRLADLAPTVLDLMGLPKPAEMTGESLIAAEEAR
jgi:2,3-bisphosphoglycerate-independent phosphoglycerate mutase